MCARVSWAVIGVLLCCSAVRAEEPRILFLPSPDADEAAANEEAARIYSHDLHLLVERGPPAPTAVSGDSLAAVHRAAELAGAELAFFSVAEEAASVLYTIDLRRDPPEVRATRVPGARGPERARALGLKLRAILSRATLDEPSLPVPALPPPPERAPSPPPAATTTRAPAARPTRLWLSTAYVAIVPLEPSRARHGVAVTAALRLWRGLGLALAIDLTSPSSGSSTTGGATMFDLPLRLAIFARGERGRWAGRVGAAASLHVASVNAIGPEDASAHVLTAAAGLGGFVVGAVRLHPRLWLELGLLAEAIVPRTRFLIAGQAVTELDPALFAVQAGLEVPLW